MDKRCLTSVPFISQLTSPSVNSTSISSTSLTSSSQRSFLHLSLSLLSSEQDFDGRDDLLATAVPYMPGDLYGNVEVIPSLRRRASTEYSTGLDYTSCILVDEDIVSRVRSLLLSRNQLWPSHTANPLDNEDSTQPDDCEFISGFDFSSAKSIAKLARKTTERLSVPDIRRAHSKSDMADLKPTQPKLKSILRKSSSTNDLKVSADFPPKSAKFQFPKLSLQDKKKSEPEGIKSCVEISPFIPVNDKELHQKELDCCPPCDPGNLQPSKYLVNHAKLPGPGLEVGAADPDFVICGCKLGLRNCPQHRRRSDSTLVRSLSFDRQIGKESPIQMGILSKNMKARSAPFDGTHSRYGTGKSEDSMNVVRNANARPSWSARKSARSPIERTLSPISSATSGSTMDAFPHAVQSSELAAMEESTTPFSTTVATNFSLPGYKQNHASQSLRTKLAEISARIDQGSARHFPGSTHQLGPQTSTRDEQRSSPQQQQTGSERASADLKYADVNALALPSSTKVPTNVSIAVVQPDMEQPPSNESPTSRNSHTSIPRKPVPLRDLDQDYEDMVQARVRPRVSFTEDEASNQTVDRKVAGLPSIPKISSPLASLTHAGAQQSDFVREKKSDSSLKSDATPLKSKLYSPSLLSGASRASVIRHSLLQSPATDTSPIDVGLPLPPLLSTVSTLSEQVMPSDLPYDGVLRSTRSDSKNKTAQRGTEYFDTYESVGDETRETVITGDFVSEPRADEGVESQSNGLENKLSEIANTRAATELTSPPRRIRGISPVPMSGHLTELQKAKDLVDIVRGRIQEAEKQMNQAMAFEAQEGNGSATSQPNGFVGLDNTTAEVALRALSKAGNVLAASTRDLVGPQSHLLSECKSLDEVVMGNTEFPTAEKRGEPVSNPSREVLRNDLISPEDTGMEFTPAPEQVAISSPTQDQGPELVKSPRYNQSQPYPPHTEYWGFVPTFKDAVQNAIQSAVRSAVQDIAVSPGVDESSHEDRQLVSSSSTRASKNLDNNIQRSAARHFVPLSDKDSEATVILSGRNIDQDEPSSCEKASLQEAYKQRPESHPPIASSSPSRSSVPGSVSSRENDRVICYDRSKFISQHQEHSPRRPLPPGNLESISLDSDCKLPFDDSDKTWKIFEVHPSKKRAPPGYTAIPARHSSKNRVLGPKTKATNSFANISAQGSLIESHQRSSKRGQGVRSTSSAGSLDSASFVDRHKDVVELTPLNPVSSRRKSMSSISLSGERLGRKNTVHWLKDLLSTNGPYETRFTALPPRTRGARPLKSLAAPVESVDQQYLGEEPDLSTVGRGIAKPQSTKTRDDKRTDISESFTRTIKDLENLMNEALHIARQATDSPEICNLQDGLEKSISVLHDSHLDWSKVEARLKPRLLSPVQSRRSVARCSDSDFSEMSLHESLQSYSSSSDIDQSDEDDLSSPAHVRNVTISAKKLRSRHVSGWPPTGRSSTPYPPASFPPSRTSVAVESRPVQDNNDPLEQIRAADPRSMHTETNVDITAMSMTAHHRSSEGLIPQQATMVSTTCPDKRLAVQDVMIDQPGANEIGPLPQLTPTRGSEFVPKCIEEHSEEDHQAIRAKLAAREVPGKQEVRDYILEKRHLPIPPRASSFMLRKRAEFAQSTSKTISGRTTQTGQTYIWQDIDYTKIEPCSRMESRRRSILQEPQMIDPNRQAYSHSLDGSFMTHSEVLDFDTGYGVRHRGGGGDSSRAHEAIELRDSPGSDLPPTTKGFQSSSNKNHFSLGGKRHISLRDHHVKGFSLARSHKRQKIARDWSPGRKRFVATVACISTALIGILVGIYAGETPAIQYYIVDFHHYTVLGNVFFFIGLAIPTFLFWPLPLLHGRKPYIMGSMSLAMPLLFPQALAVGDFRSPYVATWRVGLILSRALMGFCLGFANMNFKQMLTDLFGASLQSTNPHQEHVDEFDVRRHGGGMGVWLGLWTWCALGSIGIGFMIGAVIINTLNPAWGFYVSICIIAFVMLLNVLCPEVRRSAFRRSVAEVVNDGDVSRRLARGEVKMHMVQTGPKWWGEEFHYGVILSQRMLRQPGFLIMALYTAWIYGQQVLITLLLGALMSKDYKFPSPQVGAAGLAIPVGALVAIPFQKASIFSRARQIAPVSDDGTFKKKISWTSHMVRRSIFVLCLPLAGIAYTLSSGGPPIPFILPILFAALVGFLSNLAMAECHGIIMETFDTSDLQPGMTGRSRGSAGDKVTSKRTNYSSFPRVSSGFAITQGFGYLIAAAASGVGGVLTRHLGQQAATGVMAGILLVLSILLLGTLIRYTNVQIIPDSKKDEMEQYLNARRNSALRQQQGIQEDEPWRPIIIGNPHHTTRRMCLLELGSLSRFSEIRLKNKLVDEQSLEAKHPNQAAINELKHKIHEKEAEVVNHVRRSLSRHSSKGSRRSRSEGPEQGDLGGHREMLNRGGSGNSSGRSAPSPSRGLSGRESARKGTSLARKGIEE